MTTNDGKHLFNGSAGPRSSSRRRHGGGLLLGGLAALALGCAGGSAPDPVGTTGEVGMTLKVSDGVDISAVTYAFSGGPTVLTGSIDVGKSATISATLGPLAVGGDYSLSLAATTSAGARCTGSAGPFAVTGSASTPVSIVLTCPSVHPTGGVAVSGELSVCPSIAAVTAAPSEVYVGNDVRLVAVAGPDDAAHGRPLTYAWTGVTSSDGAGNAVFHCASPGSVTVSLAVSNGDPACDTTPADPSRTSSITVTCTDDGSGTP